jgi:hypothetical protein
MKPAPWRNSTACWRPGGTLVLNLPAFEWLRSAHDTRVHNARRYTAPGATALLAAAGFRQIETRYWNSLLLPLMVAQRKLRSNGSRCGQRRRPLPAMVGRHIACRHPGGGGAGRLGLRFPAGGSVLVVASRPARRAFILTVSPGTLSAHA